MKKTNLFLVSSLIFMLGINAAQACTRHLFNQSNGPLVDLLTGQTIPPGGNIPSQMNCGTLNAKYDYGVHKYFNQSLGLHATTFRDRKNPNYVKVIMSNH